MKLLFPKVLVFSVFLLGVAFSGLGSSLRAAVSSSPKAADSIAPDQGFLGHLPARAELAAPSATTTPTRVVTPVVAAATRLPGQTLYAFLEAPQGPVDYPYVNLSGFQVGTFASDVQIVGTLNLSNFMCPGSPCTLPLPLGESRITFQAMRPNGASSDPAYATVWTSLESDGYHVTVESVSQFLGQTPGDSCLKLWGIEDDTYPSWAEFPQYPFELHTRMTLHYLATRLIVHGLVDTKDCPAGGLSADLTWPNGCGLERARDKMIEWQNKYDDAIWAASNQSGIPPKILKTLIQVESQFWPGNERFYVDEYGLGQMNEVGVDVLMRSNNEIYQQACQGVLTDCFVPYVSLSPVEQAMIRGAFISGQNASCASCENGIDLTKAEQSVTYIAQLLQANCKQAKAVLDLYGASASYEDYWKFTLVSYHSGMRCLEQGVRATKKDNQPVDWEHVAKQLSCGSSRKYVDGFWGDLNMFDTYRFTAGPAPLVQFSPVFTTQTPIPSPTPILSEAQIWVGVYMDSNGNGTPEPSEGLDGIPVEVKFSDGSTMVAVTQQGQAHFDVSGRKMGEEVVVSLPGLYRSYRLYLPQGGVVPVVFTFSPPELPRTLP